MSVRDREDAVVAALQQLAPHLDGEPDPAFRAATRARLVAMAAVRTPAPEPVTGFKRLLAARAEDAAPSRWRTRMTAGLAGAALTVTAAASLVALASTAGPGDVLYGLKRGTEQTQLALAGDTRGQTLLDFASTRLDELEALVEEGPSALPAAGGTAGAGHTVLAAGADPELVIATLETMDDQTTEGTAWLTDRAVTTRDEGPLDQLDVWVSAQTDELAALAPALPDAAGAAVSHSLALLSEVGVRSDGLQTALTCSGGPAVGAADALGPTPADCVPVDPGGPPAGTAVPGTGSPSGSSDAGTETPDLPTTTGSGGTQSGDGATGSTGGLPVPGAPTTPGVPSVPGLPTPTIPGLPVPDVPLPGTNTAVPGLPLSVCVAPVTIGDC